MADKNGYLSRVTYKGGKDSYEFPFSYLRKDFVKAQIDVSEHESNTLAYLVDYTIDGHTIRLTKPVDADKTITIYRETSSTPLVEYEDSSILRAYDLNLSQRQNLNILEEQTDIVEKNYSLSQDTKDYMYKNLMDTKTAIDNKMSETLDTVNASVSTMNDALNTATSSMDNKISQASQALEDAKANLETTKSDIEKALADTQDSMKATENRVNETKADVTKLAAEFKESESSLQDAIKNINSTNRNMSYEVGDQIHPSYLPFNCYITCVTAGTTGDTLPVIPEGDHDSGFTYMDGTATFKVDYWPLSINGKKPLNKAGDITLSKLATPRKIELTGNVTGSADFDGSKNIQIATSLADVSALAHSLLSKTTAADMREVMDIKISGFGDGATPITAVIGDFAMAFGQSHIPSSMTELTVQLPFNIGKWGRKVLLTQYGYGNYATLMYKDALSSDTDIVVWSSTSSPDGIYFFWLVAGRKG